MVDDTSLIGRTERARLAKIREWDRRELWRQDGCRDMGQWISGHMGLSVFQARRRTKAAHALEELPLVAAALEQGTLPIEKVVELARFATPEDEKELVKWARRVSVAWVRHKADLANRPPPEDTNEADEARSVRWSWGQMGDAPILWLEGVLPADQGAVVVKAIERAAAQVPKMPDEDSTYEARCADALYALASAQLATDQDPSRAHVVVHMPFEALNGDGACEVERGPIIHPAVAQELLCDSRLQVVLENKKGTALGIGYASREVPTWLHAQLLHRDRGCTFPGCNDARFLKAHHIVPWPFGPTELDNLVLVCAFHHRAIHRRGWRVELTSGGAVWRHPGGAIYDPGPPEPLLALQEPLELTAAGFG